MFSWVYLKIAHQDEGYQMLMKTARGLFEYIESGVQHKTLEDTHHCYKECLMNIACYNEVIYFLLKNKSWFKYKLAQLTSLYNLLYMLLLRLKQEIKEIIHPRKRM